MLLINDLQRHTAPLRRDIDEALGRVVTRGWYVLGPEVEAFESEFAAYLQSVHCVGVGNGTDALELALKAIGVGPGTRVATVANAGMYSTTAILACGAVPVWVDVDAKSMNMSPEQLRKARVDAVIVTHLYGKMAPMPDLLSAAGSAPVIEDCAQAHGASLQGRRAGTWGVAGTFSFYPTKNLGALGDGGAVVTSDPGMFRKLRALRQYGWTSKYTSTESGGRNSRLDEMQAAVLRVKLPLLDRWNARRREIAALYGMRSVEDGDVVHLYVIRSPRRDRIRAALRERGFATEVHYPVPDYAQPAVAVREVSLPETDRCCAEVLTLPCFPEMTDEEVLAIKDAITVTGFAAAES